MKDHQLTDFNQKGFVSFTPEESFVKKILNLNAVVDGIIPTYNQPSVPENATCYGSAISQRLEDEIPQEKKIDNVLYGKTTVLQTHYFPDEFIELIEDPYILKIAKAALNSDNVVLHNGSLSSVYPGNTGNGTMYHSDTSDFCNPKKAINLLGTEKKIINIMILFSDIEENLAPMKVLEGSHLPNIHKTINDHVSKKLNMLNTMDNTIQGNWIYEELLEDFNLNEISFTGKVGDIGVMNSNLLHKASENFSEVDSRKVLILNFGREEDTCFNRRYPYKDSKEFYKN